MNNAMKEIDLLELKVIKYSLLSKENKAIVSELILPEHFSIRRRLPFEISLKTPSLDIFLNAMGNLLSNEDKEILPQLEVNENEIEYCAEKIKEEAVKRGILSLSADAQFLLEGGHDIKDVIDTISDKLLLLSTTKRSAKDSVVPLKELIKITISSINEGVGFWKTGIDILDNTVGGIQKSTFWVLCADAAVGKTALVLFISKNIAQNNPEEIIVTFFSLEMSQYDIGRRLISIETDIEEKKLISNTLSAMERVKVENTINGNIANLPIFVTQYHRHINDIVSFSKTMILKHPEKKHMFIIDNLGKVQSTIKNEYEREHEITSRLADLKDIYGCNIILLHHVNKEAIGDKNKMNMYIPNESDMRGSGKIKDNADVVAYMVRPDRYLDILQFCDEMYRNTNDERYNIRGKVGLKFIKNRFGETPQIWFKHDISKGKFW